MRNFVLGCLFWAGTANAYSAEIELNGHQFKLPEGFTIEQIAGAPLVNRPISADFDEQGRLYVTDSSGSNDNVQQQVEDRPHRVVRLEDTNDDGVFDKSTVYADKLSFPEGAMFFDGSFYVAAPPEIWKFTDTDDDGVADQRDVWFDGKTLTYCANDLHGPYLGPDGWIYWCKGAFAEQTYQQTGKSDFVTKASHIFRRHPSGGPIESVMTGGMDNPVEVVFTPGGERIFSTTFLVHPSDGQRDGLLHALYGGVYGKVHGVLEGHPRTGKVLPVLSHLGPAAPCGLAQLESQELGAAHQHNILTCSFNMQRITRHVLTKQGATFHSNVSDFLISNNVDFHTTDVLEDADGSIIVLDTGGWYKLCCPTSQLSKPDLLGAIYRVRHTGSHGHADPRGLALEWKNASLESLTKRLSDDRFAVRHRARRALGAAGRQAVNLLTRLATDGPTERDRREAVWALTRIDSSSARAAVRLAITDEHESVRQAAMQSASLWKDTHAEFALTATLSHESLHNRRVAAEALGRINAHNAVSSLLATAADNSCRMLEHSLIFALMEIQQTEPLRDALTHANANVRRAALIALDQIDGDHLQPRDLADALLSAETGLRETAWWIAERHPEWGAEWANTFQQIIYQQTAVKFKTPQLSQYLSFFVSTPAIQSLMGKAIADPAVDTTTRVAILHAFTQHGPDETADFSSLFENFGKAFQSNSSSIVAATLSAATTISPQGLDVGFFPVVQSIARNVDLSAQLRLEALSALPPAQRELNETVFNFICQHLSSEQSPHLRAHAVDILESSPLNQKQLLETITRLPETGVMELQRLMNMYAKTQDIEVGKELVSTLNRTSAATSLDPNKLKEQLISIGSPLLETAASLLEKIKQENQDKFARVEAILELMPQADARRGHQVFHGTKASCLACHKRGYRGGNIGPDLNRIGQIRTDRALVEAILFPSLSFVRSYEPVTIATEDGKIHNGVIRDETNETLTLQLDAQKSIRVLIKDIEDRAQSKVSIMPAGLEKQLTPQELADLIKFLREGQ